MDPCLEASDIWPDFHEHLASEIGAHLNQTLPAAYFARLEMRPEIGIAEEGHQSLIVPDVSVVEARQAAARASAATAILDQPRTEISKSIDVKVIREVRKHPYIEIREADREHKLVTLIEILSPSNKRRGVDRESYEQKQQEILDSDANSSLIFCVPASACMAT
jgi:hypothetical protein